MPSPVTVALFLLASVALITYVAFRTRVGGLVRVPMLVGYALRMAGAITVFATVGLFAPDSDHYDEVAQAIVSFWAGDSAALPPISPGKEAFPYMLAGLYNAFGHLPLLGIIINVTISALMIPVVADATKLLGGNARVGAWLTAAFPPLLVWGSLLLREATTWFLIVGIIWAMVRLLNRWKDWPAWGLAMSAIVALYWVRGSAALIVGGAAAVALVIARKCPLRVIAATTAGVGIAAYLVLTGASKLAGGYTVEQLGNARAELSHLATTGSFDTAPTPTPAATAAAAGAAPVSDPLSPLWSLMGGVPKVLVGPFPWEWPSLGSIFAFDAAIWLALLWFSWRGWKESTARIRLLVALMPAALLLGALVVSSGNYGTMQRLRVQSAVALLPVAAIGLSRRQGEVSDSVSRGGKILVEHPVAEASRSAGH
jgi:hypothetical protein